MLDSNLIIKGPPSNYSVPKDWAVGKYIIECQRKNDPEAVINVDGMTNDPLTSKQFVNETLKLAHILLQLGVEKGDVVAIVMENNIKYIIMVTAVLYIGAIINPLNPVYTIGELKHAFDMSKPKAVFCTVTALKNILTLVQNLNTIIIFSGKATELENPGGIYELELLLAFTEVDTDTVKPAEFDSKQHTAIIFLSSGTTGLPKGVMLTHANLYYPVGCATHPDYLNALPGDVAVGVLPFFHILGFIPIILATTHSLKLIVLPKFLPELYLKCITHYKATTLHVVPPMVSFLAKHPLVQRFDLRQVRIIVCAGGCLGKEIQDEFYKSYPNVKILVTYGVTEMSGACTTVGIAQPAKVGSVGQIVPDIEAMVWNAALKKNVGPLEAGELCFKGAMVMKGYIGKENNDIDEYGFYHTGDTGYYDEEKCFFIDGRIKELIKYKGFQVAPAELEDLLLTHPAVKECAVIGIPDERAGQLPMAFIVRENTSNVTADGIVKFVAEKISIQKQLHGGVRFIDVIPRNAAGKILRQKLLELYHATGK